MVLISGQQVANAMVTLRSTDGWNASSSYTPTSAGVGHWQPTPPGFAPPSLAAMGKCDAVYHDVQHPIPPTGAASLNRPEYTASF